MAEIPASPYEEPLDLPGGERPPHNPHAPHHKKSHKKRWLVRLIILVVLGGLIASGYEVINHKKPAPPPPSNDASDIKPINNGAQPTTSNGNTFTAESLAVEFQKPTGWTVAEKDGTITAKSSAVSFKDTTGTTTNGFFRIYIRKMARDVDSKYIGRAVACQPTETLTYSNPVPSQRKTTNLSFFGYDDANNFAFFMITGNFNLKKGETLGASYGKEADTFIIVGGYSAADNKDDLSFHTMSTTGFQNAEVYKQALDLLKSLKVS